MTDRKRDVEKPVLVVFRHDLRVADNRALSAAAATGKPVVAAFVLEIDGGARPPGAARRWWLHHSLAALAKAVARLGGAPLILRRGAMGETVAALAREAGADLVHWNRRFEPAAVVADADMAARLFADGIRTERFEGHLLHDPARVRTGSGRAYRVFAPFWRALSSETEPRDPVDPPHSLRAPASLPPSERLDDWALLPEGPDWAEGLRACWTPGEEGARSRLAAFLEESVTDYAVERERPASFGTSRLSPHLTHGEITPAQLLASLKRRRGRGVDTFRKELAWREFAYHLLCSHPHLATDNVDARFDEFPWRQSAADLRRWQQGRTGYPLVDAGMRELWRTGFMHNRVRMVVASFLVKHLLIDWRSGEAWFWDTLVDADPANNPMNWQWVAGSGADAAPYFRIFNPVLQGERFDPGGEYVRRFVPELARLGDKWIHKPWAAPGKALSDAGLDLEAAYSLPLVDHQTARRRALSAFDGIRSTANDRP